MARPIGERPFDQYEAMEAALKATRSRLKACVKQNEGHGFYDVKNRVEVYKRMEAFLKKYNPTQ